MFLASLPVPHDAAPAWLSVGADSQRWILVPQRGNCRALEQFRSIVSEPLMLGVARRRTGSVLNLSLGLMVMAAGVVKPSGETLIMASVEASTEREKEGRVKMRRRDA